MALPTFCIGLLPTYASVGILAPILLTVLRLLQGISAGGEFTGSITFLVEHAPANRRGLFGSFANFGAMIGGLLGAAAGWLVTDTLPAEALHDWGWRLPFVSGLLVGAIGVWIRLGVPDSPAFTELRSGGRIERNPLRSAFRTHRREMVLTAGLNRVVSAGYYVVFVWFVTDMAKVIGLALHVALGIGTVGLVFGFLFAPIAGSLSDRYGRRRGRAASVASSRSATNRGTRPCRVFARAFQLLMTPATG